MKARNHVIYDKDQDTLIRLASEYKMIGRDYDLEEGKLTILALPRRKKRRDDRKTV